MATYFSIHTQGNRNTIEMHRPAETYADNDALLCEIDKILAAPVTGKTQWLIDMSKMNIFFFQIKWNLLFHMQHAISARMVDIRKRVDRIAIFRQPDLISTVIVGCINSILSGRNGDGTSVRMFKNQKDCICFLDVDTFA